MTTALDDFPTRVVLGANTIPTTAPTPEVKAPVVVADRWDYAGSADVLDYTTGYMREVHNPDQLLALAHEYIGDLEFDTLVGTGLSGTIAVTDLARRLGKNYLVVRKANDGSHSYSPVEGKLGKRWLFVDDLVSSGATFCRVWDVIAGLQEDRDFQTEFVGSFLYNEERFIAPQGGDYDGRTHRWLSRYAEKYDGRYGEEPKPVPMTEKDQWAMPKYDLSSFLSGGGGGRASRGPLVWGP